MTRTGKEFEKHMGEVLRNHGADITADLTDELVAYWNGHAVAFYEEKIVKAFFGFRAFDGISTFSVILGLPPRQAGAWGAKLSRTCLKRVAHVRHSRLTAFYPPADSRPHPMRVTLEGSPGVCPIYIVRLLSSNPATARAYSVQTGKYLFHLICCCTALFNRYPYRILSSAPSGITPSSR